ncbi:MAG: hypothetical protein ABI180_18185 [Microcoleus sp.]
MKTLYTLFIGRRKKEEGRRKTEDGRRKKEDGRRKTENLEFGIWNREWRNLAWVG